ncbi:1-aminocyclopropane-1-carboxylate synthase [Camellia lanceoleosa]|uniref:1-aminocyclopropane-1-carboxylate synthase n=1 Tax=Camellia lanceoleosa TaxID=1840588 RepID=A0ACC0IWV8_9ERIC|nr:1-aminocyclopropane-1-carboxylate synthase [Camellia lanceoleosa]
MEIDCLNSNAGLFYWMDLCLLLKEPTIEAEMALWRVIINDVKLNVSPGSSFHCTEVGWFRVCFANMDDDTVEIALQRIRTFVTKKNGGEVAIVKKKRWQMNLRLSFSSRICERRSGLPKMLLILQFVDEIPNLVLVLPYPLEG